MSITPEKLRYDPNERTLMPAELRWRCEAAAARIEALEAALRPFVGYAVSTIQQTDDAWVIKLPLDAPQPSFADFDRARAALPHP